jgi:hypothetical protein
MKESLLNIVRGGGGTGTGATYAYRSECFDWPWAYPDFYLNEDRLLPLRARLLGHVLYLDEELVSYRSTALGFFRTLATTKAMAKFNPAYMQEVSRTLRRATEEGRLSEIAGKLLAIFATQLPLIWGAIFCLRKNPSVLARLNQRVLYNLLFIDTLPRRIANKLGVWKAR